MNLALDYYCEASLGGNTTRQPSKKAKDEKLIDYQKLLTLGVNNLAVDKDLVLKFMTGSGDELSQANFDISKLAPDTIVSI